MNQSEIDKLIAGRDECFSYVWNDLLALKDHYNDLRNKAIKLGLQFEDINPDAIKLMAKIAMIEMRMNNPTMQMPIPKMPTD